MIKPSLATDGVDTPYFEFWFAAMVFLFILQIAIRYDKLRHFKDME
jgi:hypothetical protein